MNCSVVPAAVEGFAGVTAIDTSAGAVTARVVVPCTPLKAAVIVVPPTLNPVACPAVLMVATPGAAEIQVAEEVKSWVVPSL